MIEQNVFVKKLDVIETLGACSLICTDKTGTLTLNKMTVANTWCYNSRRSATDFAAKLKDDSDLQSRSLIYCAALNSRVCYEQQKDSSEIGLKGDATEIGLYNYVSNLVGTEIEVFRLVAFFFFFFNYFIILFI